MSTNYNKFFNNNVKEDEQTFNTAESEETTNTVDPEEDAEDSTTVTPDPEPKVSEETIEPEEQTTPIPVYGINNCTKLNVRTEPNKDGDIVCVLDSKSEFEIEELESNPDWVKVIGDNGVEGFVGFCMKMYVAIK